MMKNKVLIKLGIATEKLEESRIIYWANYQKANLKRSVLLISLKKSVSIMYEIDMKAHYLSQPYFWEQQSYVERPFVKFREREQKQNFSHENLNVQSKQRRCAFKVLSSLLPLACAQPTYVYLHKHLYSFVIFAFKLLFSISFKV